MLTAKAGVATAALSLALAALGSSPVAAQTSGVCAGEIVIDEYGTITCLATTPGSGGGTDPVDDGGDGGNSSGGNGGNSGNGGVDDGAGRVELVIGLTGQTCTPIGLTDPQPPKNDAVWEGNDDGAIFDCVINSGAADSADVGEVIQMHAAADTPLAPPPPDPAVLAQQAVDSMGLQPVEIGIIPEPGEGSLGTVGLPQWMWVSDPGPETTGPNTASASLNGYTVTAIARLDRVEWDMGNGQVVACDGPGTVWSADVGFDAAGEVLDSPDCGYRYQEMGDYEVTATSFWEVEWSGIGETGQIDLTLADSTAIRMGEVQVLVQ